MPGELPPAGPDGDGARSSKLGGTAGSEIAGYTGRGSHFVARFGPPYRVIAVLTMTMAVFTIPWIVFLGFSLPPRYDAGHWQLLWIGYDVGEVTVLAYTAWAAWFRRQVLATSTLVVSILFFCDAWFDIVTSYGHRDQWVTLATGLGVEIPLGIFFAWLYRHIVMRSLIAYHQAIQDGQVPTNFHTARMIFDPGGTHSRPEGGEGVPGTTTPMI